MLDIMSGFMEQYYIEVQTLGYDKNHIQLEL